jgi:hypothetical protein
LPFQTPNTNIQSPLAEVPRDRYGRPLITPIGGGEPVAYTRASKLGSALSDQFNLTKWKKRMVALGMARRPDLLTAVAANHDNKTKLDELCEQAMEAAGATEARNMGTAIHQLTEIVDLGGPLPEPTPPAAVERVQLYQATIARAQLTPVLVETFIVNDELQVAGTFDRLMRTPAGPTLIADLKTGMSLINGNGRLWPDSAIEMCVQLAVYASGKRYDPATGQRSPLDEDLDPTRGIIIALPALGGPCRLVQLDLVKGSQLAGIAAHVLQTRKTRQLDQTRLVQEEN